MRVFRGGGVFGCPFLIPRAYVRTFGRVLAGYGAIRSGFGEGKGKGTDYNPHDGASAFVGDCVGHHGNHLVFKHGRLTYTS